jgi:hypothetical protein
MNGRISAPYAPRAIDEGRHARPTGGVGGRRSSALRRSARTPHALVPRFRARFRGFPFFLPVGLVDWGSGDVVIPDPGDLNVRIQALPKRVVSECHLNGRPRGVRLDRLHDVPQVGSRGLEWSRERLPRLQDLGDRRASVQGVAHGLRCGCGVCGERRRELVDQGASLPHSPAIPVQRTDPRERQNRLARGIARACRALSRRKVDWTGAGSDRGPHGGQRWALPDQGGSLGGCETTGAPPPVRTEESLRRLAS